MRVIRLWWICFQIRWILRSFSQIDSVVSIAYDWNQDGVDLTLITDSHGDHFLGFSWKISRLHHLIRAYDALQLPDSDSYDVGNHRTYRASMTVCAAYPSVRLDLGNGSSLSIEF